MSPASEASKGLRSAWSDLVRVLDLGPAPETRICPTCKGVGMRGASRCSNCWASLATLPSSTEGKA